MREKYFRDSKNFNASRRQENKAASCILASVKQKIKRKQINSKNYKKNSNKISENRRARYALNLSEPSYETKQKYISQIRECLSKNNDIQKQLQGIFDVPTKADASVPVRVIQASINLLTARTIVNKIYSVRKHYAGQLLGAVKKVKKLQSFKNEEQFGEKRHLASSELYYYNACYRTPDKPSPIPVQ